jgi:hypothetical protein
MSKPAKEKVVHVHKHDPAATVHSVWASAINDAGKTPDTAVVVQFDTGDYRLPEMSNGQITIVGDDLVEGEGGVQMTVYTDTETGHLVVDYTAVLPPPPAP